ncbi:MAG: DNA topoisomerase III [Bacteroidetes bacterium GWF2_42_66]|nr:MAG: DNA topoisomerase III [Bacteroidetes bacterium GWE2_42_39]OFY40650.1 MAG: DNA topoisomerase III [Bacteroidetes bacterium GWF2_42_66]HBL76605.1 DNA topoisomerase III [Prolixibacteraceae bacterium]HCU61240.1 DNA topoisomerase III [Prolixibacteraceae bacterium]
MKLCIAEKPAVAREIALIIGANARKDGYFEGNGYQVSWTFGHLCTLKEPHDYLPQWKSWNMQQLPMIPPKFGIKLIDNPGIIKQFGILEKLITTADEIINCGDAGQEGELIQRWVLAKAGNKAPIKRLWISSLTEEAIREGFSKLLNGNDFDQLYQAGSARAIGDWLLGMNATRAYTLKYGQNKQVLSIGRVQTPTLALIVTRQKEIDNFKPEPYFEIRTIYREAVFSAISGRYQKREDARQVLDDILDKDLIIGQIETKESNEYPPKLFDLTSLQVECNRRFDMGAEETLKTIQSLYEKKVTTYPRVDTTFLSDDIYKKVPTILKNLRGYENLTSAVLEAGKIPKTKRVFDNTKITDHHAIIPTGENRIDLIGKEKDVYDLVTKRFISAFYPDCRVANTTVEATIGQHGFKATGKQILKPGWRVVYQNEKKTVQDDENILPVFIPGEQGPHQPELQEKETKPPNYYTEATLLRAMETAGKLVDDEELRELMKENGIGRPSTRANIIETLFRRRYVRKEKKRLVASQTGIDLIDSIENELLKSAELTGQWERKLRLIESGEMEMGIFMDEMKNMVKEVITQLKNSPRREIAITEDEKPAPPVASKEEKQKAKSRDKAPKPATELKCPVCGNGTILKGNNAWGCSGWKNGCRFTIPFEFAGKKLSENQMAALVTKRKTPPIKGFAYNELKIDGTLILGENHHIRLLTEVKENSICPHCHTGKIVKGKTAWGCTNFKGGCAYRIPFEVEG